jgi:hypothetical protein
MAIELVCTAVVNGTDISPYVTSIRRTGDICQGVSSLDITLDSSYDGVIYPNETVFVEEYGYRKFTGYVNGFTRSVSPAQSVVACSDVLKRAKTYFLSESIYSSGQTVSYWIDYFLDLAGLPFRIVDQTSEVVPPDTVFELDYVLEIVKKLCSTQGWVLFADELGIVHAGDYLSYGTPTYIFSQGTNLLSVDHQINDGWLRNKIVVWGNGDVMATVEHLDNPYLGGETRAAAIYSQRITTNAQAATIAGELAADMSVPYDSKACGVASEGLNFPIVGDTVLVFEDFTDLGQSCIVTTLDDTMGPATHVGNFGLDAKCPYYWGWGSGVIPISGAVYLGHKDAGVYRYSISSDTAVQRNNGLTGTAQNVHDLKVDPHSYGDGRRRLWLTSEAGVYKSEDDTQSWSKVTLPNPINAAGDSPAPSVASLEWYSVEFDKVYSRVVYILAGTTSPCRLWLYVTKDGGVTWTSIALHAHSDVGSGGWTSWGGGFGANELVYFEPADKLYFAYCDAPNHLYAKVFDFDGVGFSTALDFTDGSLEGLTWNCYIKAVIVAQASPVMDSRLFVVVNCYESLTLLDKVVVYMTRDGITWFKILDTFKGIGMSRWTAIDGVSCSCAIDANDTVVLAIITGNYVPVPPPPDLPLWYSYDTLGCYIISFSYMAWRVEVDDGLTTPSGYAAISKTRTGNWPPGADIVWLRDLAGRTRWRMEEGVWEIKDIDSGINWGWYQWETYYYENYLYWNGSKRCHDGYNWYDVDRIPTYCGVPIGEYEDRLVTFSNEAGDAHIYIETMHGLFELDYFRAGGFGIPKRSVEAWGKLWLVTTLTGLWSRDTVRPLWWVDLKRSAKDDNQGHQYSLAALPNYPWVVYVAAAREYGGLDYIRVIRINADCRTIMSHTFDPQMAGFVRVAAPNHNTSDEIVYAFGYGDDGGTGQMIWLFKTAYIPFDITGDGWIPNDEAVAALHDGDEQDWVIMTALGKTRGTTEGGGGDLWNDLTDVNMLVDGADRIGREILAGGYLGGTPMLKYSGDRAQTWENRGSTIITTSGISSVQIVDKLNFGL